MTNAQVELVDVAFNNCGYAALQTTSDLGEATLEATRCEFAKSDCGAVVNGTSATFNNCVFKDNDSDGIEVENNSTVHLHGDATAIHSNGIYGISAHDCMQNFSAVIIHLPSHHNTIYNNGNMNRRNEEKDRHKYIHVWRRYYYQRRGLKKMITFITYSFLSPITCFTPHKPFPG